MKSRGIKGTVLSWFKSFDSNLKVKSSNMGSPGSHFTPILLHSVNDFVNSSSILLFIYYKLLFTDDIHLVL